MRKDRTSETNEGSGVQEKVPFYILVTVSPSASFLGLKTNKKKLLESQAWWHMPVARPVHCCLENRAEMAQCVKVLIIKPGSNLHLDLVHRTHMVEGQN